MTMDSERPSEWVHYTEQRGNLPGLRQLAQAWAGLPGFMGSEVLHSPSQVHAQGELYLLVTRWHGAVPQLELPQGAKGWAFAVLEQIAAAPT